jgi:hypothetical protein
MKVINEYSSHHYEQEYKKIDLFCPNCGKKEVWEEQGEGDYYSGTKHICTSCNNAFYLPSLYNMEQTHELSIVEQLKSGKTKKPSTKRGK